MGERFEWVQIIEPKSKDTMYANLVTGECVWKVPPGAKIKCTDDNQWWELFDASTKRHYYYNAKSQRTAWQRPSGADIIPLAKLQMIKENTEPKDEQTIITTPTLPLIKHTVQQLTITNSTPAIVTHKWKQISLQGLDLTPQDVSFKISAPIFQSATQRSTRQTGTVFYPYPMFSSSIANNLTASQHNKDDKSTYDNLINAIEYPINTKTNQQFTNNAYDNYPVVLNQQFSQPQRSRSIHLKSPATLQMITNETDDQRSNASTDSLPPTYYQSPNIIRHISSPALETVDNSSANFSNLTRSSLGRTNIRKKQPRTNPNYVNLQVKTNDGSLRSTYIRLDNTPKCPTSTFSSSSSNSSSEHDSLQCTSQSNLNELHNGYFPSDETISTEKTTNERRNELIIRGKSSSSLSSDEGHLNQTHTLTNKTGAAMKQFITCTDEFVFHSTTDPLSLNFQQMKAMNNGDNRSYGNVTAEYSTSSNTSTLSSPVLPMYYDSYSNSPSIASFSMNRSHDAGSIDSSTSSTRPASIRFNGTSSKKKLFHTSLYKQVDSVQRKDSYSFLFDSKQCASSSSSTTTNAKSSTTISELESNMLSSDTLNLNIHKRGLFSKRLSQDHLLSWSKESLTKPLMRTADKILKKEAPEVFKLIQTYMGDKKSKQMASLNTCLELTTKGWSLSSIRDELYLQLIKQTTSNQNAESLQHGWELMAICLSFFPPSNKFQILLEHYISSQANGDVNTPEVPISIYAKVCQKRLEKILQTGPKKGLKKPTYEEIELSKHTIHFPSMFGASLEEVMAMQRSRHPERRLPWVQTILSEEVLRLNGAQTEGIFRVPGDLDSVNALKVKCDQWQISSPEDAHLPASLLKLWYRELAEPLIPSVFYERCILNCDQAETCIGLVNSLPDINRVVLTYLIRFLQIFAATENVMVTKMDVNNLSMVFAPNILRCNSEDAKVIFENARKEMLFVKSLILHLDTDSMNGVI